MSCVPPVDIMMLGAPAGGSRLPSTSVFNMKTPGNIARVVRGELATPCELTARVEIPPAFVEPREPGALLGVRDDEEVPALGIRARRRLQYQASGRPKPGHDLLLDFVNR